MLRSKPVALSSFSIAHARPDWIDLASDSVKTAIRMTTHWGQTRKILGLKWVQA